tara:strand:+ start:44 stop:400 length:357 start_codon:yes stop_codon:yes gene_type:complete
MVKKKMKIEYINSFGPPEYVELKDNNIGIVVSEKETKGVELSDDSIDLFWQTINEIDVWNWKREYSPEEKMLDGHIWELSLTSGTGRSKKVWGQETYPTSFNELIKALNLLFETKIDI